MRQVGSLSFAAAALAAAIVLIPEDASAYWRGGWGAGYRLGGWSGYRLGGWGYRPLAWGYRPLYIAPVALAAYPPAYGYPASYLGYGGYYGYGWYGRCRTDEGYGRRGSCDR